MQTVLDIPDSVMLSVETLEAHVSTFCNLLMLDKPNVICLPLIDFGGANYPSRYLGQNSGPWASFELTEYARQVKDMGCKLYLSIIPYMQFIKTESIRNRTQLGRVGTNACLSNPTTQRVLKACIDEAVELLKTQDTIVDGIVLDICDLNGSGARDGRITLTCFCQHCTSVLSRLGKFDYRIFSSHPNPINLALRETETGVRNFNIDLRRLDPALLVELSKDNLVFDESMFENDDTEQTTTSESKQLSWARKVLEYAEARSKVTAHGVSAISEHCSNKGIKFIVAIGRPSFDWTVGTDLWHLAGIANEVWLDTEDLTANDIPSDMSVYHYLNSRGRYIVSNFFEAVADMEQLFPMATGTDERDLERALRVVDRRVGQARGSNHLSRANAAVIELQDWFSGYVGVTLTEQVVLKVSDLIQATHDDIMKGKSRTLNTSAQDVLIFLMQLAQSGRPIDMNVLSQVAKQLGVLPTG